ncbi:hypothetical protein [Variovorax sp. V213]|uniref:IS1096 element passenger TnpR family protein n=1 Tax=Variovorax sp. V213 TaxID=3065955 RepID=UPI0034E8A482
MYDDPGSITSESTRLTTALNRSTLSYVYDFGDYWDHRIRSRRRSHRFRSSCSHSVPAVPVQLRPTVWGRERLGRE